MTVKSDSSTAKVLFIEPIYGGSHRLFADKLCQLSRHRFRLLSLPASFWKWRMRGAHLSLAAKVKEFQGEIDCLVTSDMLSLAEMLGLVPELNELPKIVYFHENQLSYPVPRGEEPDVHFGFNNLSTALAADRLVFNSIFHQKDFLGGIDPFLGAMPDHRPRALSDVLREKSLVIYPGIDCRELDLSREERSSIVPLTILWNHRWEFDKDPEAFFAVLKKLAGEGIPFKINVVGENFQVKPKAFLEGKAFHQDRLGRFGYIVDRQEYIRVLWDSDVVVSTSLQEFFGISIMEAAYCRCYPIVPDRLVYPELYESSYRYDNENSLFESLRKLIISGPPQKGWYRNLRRTIKSRYDVRSSVASFDDLISSLI